MMNGYYTTYLVNSETYKNLGKALGKMEDLKQSLESLKNQLSKYSGNEITKMINDLSLIILNIDNYKQEIIDVRNQLYSKAMEFNTALNNWKSKIGSQYGDSKSELQRPTNDDLDNNTRSVYVVRKIIDKVIVNEATGYINLGLRSTIDIYKKTVWNNTSEKTGSKTGKYEYKEIKF